MVAMPRSPIASRGSAEQHGREVDEQFVDESGREEGAREGGAALDEERADAATLQLAQVLREVGALEEDRGVRMTRDRGIRRHRASSEDHGHRLRVEELATRCSSRERGVVGEDGARADRDGIGSGASAMHVGACRGTRDPLAGAVGCRGAPVEARGPLHGHVRSAVPGCEEPVVEERLGLVGEHSVGDLDARFAEPVGAARGVVARVGDGVDDACDTGIDEGDGAWTRASDVIAGLERHDRGGTLCVAGGELGERVDLGMGRAGAAVPSLCEHLAVRGEDDAADARVDALGRAARGQFEGAAHGGGIRHRVIARVHPMSRLLGSGGCSAMPRCRSPRRRLRRAQPTRAASHPDFHRRYRNSTGSTARSRPLGLALAARGLSPPVRTYTDPGARFSCRF